MTSMTSPVRMTQTQMTMTRLCPAGNGEGNHFEFSLNHITFTLIKMLRKSSRRHESHYIVIS